MDLLPDEVLESVFGFLPAKARQRCSAVCRRWRAIVSTPRMWLRMQRRNVSLITGMLCRSGDLNALQRHVAQFSVTADDVRLEGNRALFAACIRGHIAVVAWLAARFGFGMEDFRANSQVLAVACERGHVEFMQ